MEIRETFWSRLSPRERVLILALALTAFVMGTLLLLYLRNISLQETRAEIDNYRDVLNKVYTRGAVYEERLAAKRLREADIATKPILFSTLLEDAQRGIENFNVSDQEELPILELGDGLVKRSFEFKLRGVKLKDAVNFLTAIESQPQRIILTEQLKVRSLSPLDDSLNCDVTISTWERQEEEENDNEDDEENDAQGRGDKKAEEDES